MRRIGFVTLGLAHLLGCAGQVVLEKDDENVHAGKGGYLGSGEPDQASAIEEVCGILKTRLPKCPQETCIDYAFELLTVGEASGCGEQAVDVLYCTVQNANEHVCMGHHACEALEAAYDECWMTTCAADPDMCGL